MARTAGIGGGYRLGGEGTLRATLRTALILFLIAHAVTCGAAPLQPSGVPERTAARLAIGVAKVLSAPIDLTPGILEVLARKHSEVLEPGDEFWPKTIDAIMDSADLREALEKRVRSNFSANRELYARLTRDLPALADVLATTLSFDGQGKVEGYPVDEVLRRMRVAPLAAQRALMARAIDPSNNASEDLAERIASTPRMVADVESDVLGLRSSKNPKARILSFRYSLARGLEVPDAELRYALNGTDLAALRAALARIATFPSNRVATFAAVLTRITEQAVEADLLGASLRLLLTVAPGAGASLIDRHRADTDFWLSAGGYEALGAMAVVPASLPSLRERLAYLPLSDMLASGRCDVIVPAIVISPDIDARRAAQLLTSLLSNVASSRNQSSCSIAAVANALDGC